MKRLRAALVIAIALATCASTLTLGTASADPATADQAIPGAYIVALRPVTPGTESAAASQLAASHGATVTAVYQNAFQGFAATASASSG